MHNIVIFAKIKISNSFVVVLVVEKILLLASQKIFQQLQLNTLNGLLKKPNGIVRQKQLELAPRVIVSIGHKLFGVRLHKLVAEELNVLRQLAVIVCHSGVFLFATTQNRETFSINCLYHNATRLEDQLLLVLRQPVLDLQSDSKMRLMKLPKLLKFLLQFCQAQIWILLPLFHCGC